MVEQSQTVSKLFAAVVSAGGELRNPPKDSVNPHFKSRYADLATVLDTVRPVLAKYKLAVVQLPTELEGGPGLATTLVHESGEWMRSTVRLYPGKTDPQGIGSALTYARRYGLQAALGIAADDDDDGQAGSRPAQQQHKQQQPPANVVNMILKDIQNAMNTAALDAIAAKIGKTDGLTDQDKTQLRTAFQTRKAALAESGPY
jgi:hypothetical protein